MITAVMAAEIKVYKLVEPPTKPSRRRKYPFAEMEIMDAFDLEVGGKESTAAMQSAYAYARESGKKFRTRSYNGKLTIWREA